MEHGGWWEGKIPQGNLKRGGNRLASSESRKARNMVRKKGEEKYSQAS